jgi:hypothetical protein
MQFNYHMHMYLYVYMYNAIALNAIDISRCCVRTYRNRRKPLRRKDLGAKPALNPYGVRTYVNRRKCLLCKDLGAGPRPKSLQGKALYQLH